MHLKQVIDRYDGRDWHPEHKGFGALQQVVIDVLIALAEVALFWLVGQVRAALAS